MNHFETATATEQQKGIAQKRNPPAHEFLAGIAILNCTHRHGFWSMSLYPPDYPPLSWNLGKLCYISTLIFAAVLIIFGFDHYPHQTGLWMEEVSIFSRGVMGIFALLGMIILLLVVFQFLTGKRIIKVDFKYHRYNGTLILSIGFLKALLAILSELL